MKFYIKTTSKEESKQIGEIFKVHFPIPFKKVYASWNASKGYYGLNDDDEIIHKHESTIGTNTPVYTVNDFLYKYNLENILK